MTASADVPTTDPWEEHAGWLQREFTDGVDPEYEEQITPLALAHLAGATRVLDVGTGEGQLARALAASPSPPGLIVGVDASWAQVEVAARRGGGPRYVRSGAEALPFADASFDAALVCLVMEHLPDHVGPLSEIARVLRPGGRFAFFLNHPLLQVPGSGWIDDHILEEQYWRVGPYLVEDVSDEEVSPGVFLPFVHRPLNRYFNALVDLGFVVERMEEPPPPEGFLAKAPEYRDAATIPRLLLLLARRT